MSKIGRDVRDCAGGYFNLPFKQTYINWGASYDNIVGVYFERSYDTSKDDLASKLIPEAYVVYPHTKNVGIKHEEIHVPVPSDAVWMGFFIAGNGAGWPMYGGELQRGDYIRLEIQDLEDDFHKVYGYCTKDYYKIDDPTRLAKTEGQRIGTNGFGGGFHMSNPYLNFMDTTMFTYDEDGVTILMEDMRPDTGWDFGVDFTTPASPCARSTHPGCDH